jgi:hypothetical protein
MKLTSCGVRKGSESILALVLMRDLVKCSGIEVDSERDSAPLSSSPLQRCACSREVVGV